MTLDISGSVIALALVCLVFMYVVFADWVEHRERMAGADTRGELESAQSQLYELSEYFDAFEEQTDATIATLQAQVAKHAEHMASISGDLIEAAHMTTSLDANIAVVRAMVDHQAKVLDEMKKAKT